MVSCALALTGCADIETTPHPAEQEPAFVSGTGRERSSDGLVPELYGPGSSWYAYEASTHVLTPKPYVYALRAEGALTLFEVVSYYDERGESGVFTLRARSQLTGEPPGEVKTLTLSSNIKEAPVCVDALVIEEGACREGMLLFGAAFRPLPSAGFAVQEPFIHVLNAPLAQASSRVDVTRVEAQSIEDVPLDEAVWRGMARLPDASLTPEDSLVGWLEREDTTPRQDVFMHITSTMHAAQWRVLQLEQRDGAVEVTLGIRCQAITATAQQPMPVLEQTRRLTLARSGAHAHLRISLCEAPEGDSSSSFEGSPYWPDTRSFDLVLESHSGRLSARTAPGNLLSNRTLAAGEMGAQPLPLGSLLKALE